MSPSKQWIVGYFEKENKYSVIPFSWIVNCGNICLSKWPKSGTVHVMISEATEPEMNWPTFPVKIVSEMFNKFDDAMIKEKELFLSASESESPITTKKKKKKRFYYPTHAATESDSACSSTQSSPVKVMKTANIDSPVQSAHLHVEQQNQLANNQLFPNNFLSSSLDSLYGYDYNAVNHNTEQVFSQELPSSAPSTSMLILPEINNVNATENQSYGIGNDMLKKLFENSVSLLAYFKRLDSKMDSLIQMNNNFQITAAIDTTFENAFPLDSVEAIEELENKFSSDENTLHQMKQFVRKIGGTCLKNFIKRVLERLFSNRLSTKYSWTGFRENHALKNLKMMKIIRDVAMSTYAETENNFESHVKDWFRHGAQRYSREKQKERESL